MAVTTIMGLPLLAAGQAQKHVTINEALRFIDALAQISVLSDSTSSPPGSPNNGDRYIVPTGATGSWSGWDKSIAFRVGNAWIRLLPATGYLAYVQSTGLFRIYNGSNWIDFASSLNFNNLAGIGINTSFDNTNKLALSSAASLFNHAGNGHQIKINKAAASNTASLLFQTGFSGRAEMGTAGSDSFEIKVSADGAAWFTALGTDPASGRVTLPEPVLLGGQASDPPSPTNGMLWLNSTTGEVKCRSAGQSVVIAPSTAGPVLDQWDHWNENWFSNVNANSYDLWAGTAIASGTIANVALNILRQAFNPYGFALRSSTSANSGYRYVTNAFASDWFGVTSRKFRGRIGTPETTVATGLVRVGWLDTTTHADATDGAYFEINGNVLSCKTAADGTRTTHGTTLTLDVAQAYVLEIDVPANAASVRFRVWEGLNATPVLDVINTSDIPVSAANAFGAGIVATASEGTATTIVVPYSMGMGTIAGYQRATGRS